MIMILFLLILSSFVLANADINNDGDVDIVDLVIVVNDFGSSNVISDTDSNGIVDIFDVVYVAVRIGTTPEPPEPPTQCTGTCKTSPCNTYTDCTTSPGNCTTGYCCKGTCTTPSGNVYYVATYGDDNNPGTEALPFRTVQKAINSVNANDTIFIKSGTYDLTGFSPKIYIPIRIIGEDKRNTVLKNGRTITFHNSLTVKNIKFTEFSGTVFKPLALSGEIIDGVTFENCIFDKVGGGIVDRESAGILTNFRIVNNEFNNLSSSGSIYAISMYRGIISNISITGNKFENMKAGTQGTGNAIAILLGTTTNRDTTKSINIINNTFKSIIGVVGGIDQNIEGHAVLAYGSDITVSSNFITDVNNAPDHEAIYLKASYSEISYNIIHNGGATVDGGGGDISIKGNGNFGNAIFGNKITGDYPGIGIYTQGEVNISNNYVKKHLGGMGVYSYELAGRAIYIKNNYIETKDRSITVYNAADGEIMNNAIISYESSLYYLSNSPNLNVHNNVECQGTNCNIVPPYPTCQNLGYICCDSCSGTAYPSYDTNCAYRKGKCCAVCG
ncbi:DUF1565 domain-containing protein [Candidatus Woesearchaeota archaeon]|nr:DUF1565 domain-containing protein [Candidatus Woesearchaeota archaeon]